MFKRLNANVISLPAALDICWHKRRIWSLNSAYNSSTINFERWILFLFSNDLKFLKLRTILCYRIQRNEGVRPYQISCMIMEVFWLTNSALLCFLLFIWRLFNFFLQFLFCLVHEDVHFIFVLGLSLIASYCYRTYVKDAA